VTIYDNRLNNSSQDESLEESDVLLEPGVLAREIVDDLAAALEQFRLIAEELGEGRDPNGEAIATKF